MPGLASDINEVYSELAAEATIVNRIPVVTNQRILYEQNAQATKPFVREHHLDATFPSNTLITTDDVVQIVTSGLCYLVMNKTPELFDGEIVEWNTVMYKCNIPSTAKIVRPLETRNAQTYNVSAGWTTVANGPIYGLLSDRIFGSEIEQDNWKRGGGAGQFPIWRIDAYFPKFYGLKPLDRLIISEKEYYKVETIESYTFPGVVTVLLVEDTRKYP